MPRADRGNVPDFDNKRRNAQVMHGNSLRITGRSPGGTRHELFRAGKIRGAGMPGEPAVVEDGNGDEYLLVTPGVELIRCGMFAHLLVSAAATRLSRSP